MNSKYFFCSEYCVGLILLQVRISASGQWAVTTPTEHLVATVGGEAELSCQLSPSQSAENLEVQWLKGKSSNIVSLYRGGHEVNEDIAAEYVNRTEFVKTAIEKGKVTLRLHNISVSDEGPYQCSFKGDNVSHVASINLSIAALGLKTQIHVQAPDFKGLMMECNSGGWYPEPQMEWRNSEGEVIPHLSKSHSQDENKLFHMKMTLFLPKRPQSNITCYICNSLLGKERQANIILSDEVFHAVHIGIIITWLFVLPLCLILCSLCKCAIRKDNFCIKDGVNLFSDQICSLISVGFQLCSFLILAFVPFIYITLRSRVSISDPLYLVYNNWIWEMAILISIMVLLYPILFGIFYFKLKGKVK